MDISGILKQAMEMRDKISTINTDLAKTTVTGSAGADMVQVTMTGTLSLIKIDIDPELKAAGDVDMIVSLLVGAVNDAIAKAKDLSQNKMQSVAGGINIPGLNIG